MEEKDFSKSIKLTFIILFGASLFWFLFACQFVWAYDPGGSPLDLKKNSRVNDTLLIQPGTGTSGGSDTARFRTFYGTQACVGVGSNGYILSGTLTGLPYIDYLYGNGSSTINFSGFTHVAIGGSDIPAASGLASLDANSLVVQNPASGTSTPGANKIIMSDGAGKVSDGWLSDNVTKLGTPTTDNISEGSTNKYYTDARVNATIGSSSITSPQVSPKITFTSPAAGQFLKIVDSQGNVENGTSSASVGFDTVTGVPTDNSYFSVTPAANKVPFSDSNGSITAWFPGGMPVRISYATTNGSGNGLGNIPYDNTIPQNTEGTQLLTVTHTPVSATNYLIVEGVAQLYTNATQVCAALFATSTAGAIGSQYVTGSLNAATGNRTAIIMPSSYALVAGTTSAMTFSLRAGSNSGDCGYNENDSGAAILGGSSYVMLKVTEYKP